MNQASNPYIQNSFLSSKLFDPAYLFTHLVAFLQAVVYYLFGGGSGVAMTVLSVFALFFFTVIAYCCVRLLEIRAKEHKHLQHEITEYAHHHAEQEQKKWEGDTISQNERWLKILEYLFSPNASDWKLAIIEADLLLDSLMTQLGFKGETLGDKLKSVDRDKFRNLTIAWEVHTVRNRIAHEGSAFEVSQHEAKRVIALYEQIFREFGYI
jgi:hypothetical protein